MFELHYLGVRTFLIGLQLCCLPTKGGRSGTIAVQNRLGDSRQLDVQVTDMGPQFCQARDELCFATRPFGKPRQVHLVRAEVHDGALNWNNAAAPRNGAPQIMGVANTHSAPVAGVGHSIGPTSTPHGVLRHDSIPAVPAVGDLQPGHESGDLATALPKTSSCSELLQLRKLRIGHYRWVVTGQPERFSVQFEGLVSYQRPIVDCLVEVGREVPTIGELESTFG